eukprot:PhF_6_TR15486/c0_g1_i1/m.24088
MIVAVRFGGVEKNIVVPEHMKIRSLRIVLQCVFHVEARQQRIFGVGGIVCTDEDFIPRRVLLMDTSIQRFPVEHSGKTLKHSHRAFPVTNMAVLLVKSLKRPETLTTQFKFTIRGQNFVYNTTNSLIVNASVVGSSSATEVTPELGIFPRLEQGTNTLTTSWGTIKAVDRNTIEWIFKGGETSRVQLNDDGLKLFNLTRLSLILHRTVLVDQQYSAEKGKWLLSVYQLEHKKLYTYLLPTCCATLKEGNILYLFSSNGTVMKADLLDLHDMLIIVAQDHRLQSLWHGSEWSLDSNSWCVRYNSLFFFSFSSTPKNWCLYKTSCDGLMPLQCIAVPFPHSPPKYHSLHILRDYLCVAGMNSASMDATHKIDDVSFLDLSAVHEDMDPSLVQSLWVRSSGAHHPSASSPTARLLLDHHVVIGQSNFVHVYSPLVDTMSDVGFDPTAAPVPCPGKVFPQGTPHRVTRYIETLVACQHRRRQENKIFLPQTCIAEILKSMKIYDV